MSTLTFCGNMSVLTKMSLEYFTDLESNLRAETEEMTPYSRRGSNLMMRANINVFMWVWAFCPVCHWQLPSAQCLPLAHQPWSRKEAPGCSAVFPPLSHYTAGDVGAI